MTTHCSICNAQIDSSQVPAWVYCPQCGTALARGVSAEVDAGPLAHEAAPVKRAFGGLFFGIIVTPVFIIVGTMLCLTGLGAFLGIPMIVAGALAPLLGPMIGMDTHAGKCPWCGAKVSIVPLVDCFHCQACNGRITVKNHRDMARAS